MGKHPLEVSFDRVFPSFGDSYILKADYGGPLLENILCISFLPRWYPWGPTFHDTVFSTVLVETEPAIMRLTSQPSLGIFSVLVVLNLFGARGVGEIGRASCRERV